MQEHRLNQEHIMSDVYSYPYPEVRELLVGQMLDPKFMVNTLMLDEANILLKPYGFEPELDIPTTNTGEVDLDTLHEPVIDRIRNIQKDHLPGIETFHNAYPMPGSSQSMYTLMAEWSSKGIMNSLAVRTGEYDGYVSYAKSLGINVNSYDEFSGHVKKPGEIWFVSNPNAREGNWIEDDEWLALIGDGHEIVLDTAYVGLTAQTKPLDVSASNIRAVLTSPSKLFGVFRYRNTGITYVRDPVDAMYGSRWFKDIPALLASLSLYETFGHNELPKKYRSAQEYLCKQLSELVENEVHPSDVLLLAYTKGPVTPEFEGYKRAEGYRFGLTKLFEDIETKIDTFKFEDQNNGNA